MNYFQDDALHDLDDVQIGGEPVTNQPMGGQSNAPVFAMPPPPQSGANPLNPFTGQATENTSLNQSGQPTYTTGINY